MLYKLCDDILLMILFNLTNVNDIINLSEINNDMYKSINNDIYLEWGRYIYSKDFWIRATKRQPIYANPLPNMKMELIRLRRFNDAQIKHGHELWTKEDYYKYWDSLELYIKEGDKPSTLERRSLLHKQSLTTKNILNMSWPNYWRLFDYVNRLLF